MPSDATSTSAPRTVEAGAVAWAGAFIERIKAKSITVGVIGLGYVGLPICLSAAEAGLKVLGFDIDPRTAKAIADGRSYLGHIPDTRIAALTREGRFSATTDFARLSEADAILICVPTPLTPNLEPDMTYIVATAEQIAKALRPHQLVVLESTTYPGTTREVLLPILEKSGLTCPADFMVAFSPEREDPGNPEFGMRQIPKIVGADSAEARDATAALYDQFVVRTVKVSSAATAEAVKLTENIFRAVNIALANELKVVYGAMGIDIWEVIDAAKTKPFGYMPFYPGPGLGGHCIPIDPFYLTWKAREFGISTRFIELAGQVNSAMPQRVVDTLALTLDARTGKGLNGARILILGIAYKKNVDDVRGSPSLRIMELLEARGATLDFYDPHVPVVPNTREHPTINGRRGRTWAPTEFGAYDAALIVTDHDRVDYKVLASHVRLVIDTRNACRRAGTVGDHIVGA